MIAATIPDVESQRLAVLHELSILDTLEEEAYDDLTMLAAQICQTPIALVTLIDSDRQWFKSRRGLAPRETPRDIAFCSHAILDNEPFIVNDSAQDIRFCDNPLVTDTPHIRFYAGAPLIFEPGIHLGTLCVIDNRARELSAEQQHALLALARQVVSQLKLRLRVSELQQLDQAKDNFVAMVSHELRTPLTSINGALSILAQSTLHPSSEAVHEQTANLISIAHRNSTRLIHIVNDILDIAKLRAGKMLMRFDICSASFIAAQAAELNSAYCDKCGCKLTLSIRCADDVMIKADASRLQQVLSNLISNAAKFSPQGDSIELALEITGAHTLRFSITDHGPGIPPHARNLLFKRFSQVTLEPNEKLPGTGLGLSISKQIIELHGGTIGVESEPGIQTTFFFTLNRVT